MVQAFGLKEQRFTTSTESLMALERIPRSDDTSPYTTKMAGVGARPFELKI
jgi:hypothetical protein